MLPLFAAFDHVNYTRWEIVFLADMKRLPCTAPEALEHVNKSGKVAGELVGITRTECARDRWCLTYNERVKLSEDTKEMFGIGTAKDGVGHKDLGRARAQRDEDDIQRLMSHFRGYDV